MSITESMLTLLNDSMPAQKTPNEMVAEAREKVDTLKLTLARMAKGEFSDADARKAMELGKDIAFLTKSLTIR